MVLSGTHVRIVKTGGGIKRGAAACPMSGAPTL
jgi:hypothetical protein